jgi:hypothetical protein
MRYQDQVVLDMAKQTDAGQDAPVVKHPSHAAKPAKSPKAGRAKG